MKAMILAAGRGERLKPLTNKTPKPLLLINGKPLIQWHIERLVRAGIIEIVINHSWLGHKIENYLKDGHHLGANILYSQEIEKLGTGGGIKHALPLLGNNPFIVISADITTDYPFSYLKNKKLSRNALGYLIMVSNPEHHPYGDYVLHNSKIYFKNYSHLKLDNILTFGSIALMHPCLFKVNRTRSCFSVADSFNQVIVHELLYGEHYQGYHCNVDTIDRLKCAEQDREKGLINDNET